MENNELISKFNDFLNSFDANVTYFEVRTDECDSEVYILIGLKKTIKEAIELL